MKKVKSMFEKHDLFKIVLGAILLTIVLSWIIPFGYYSNGTLGTTSLGRQGIVDIVASGVYGINFFLQQLIFVLFVGIFYGIVSVSSGYKALVNNIAKKFKGKEKIFVIVSTLVIALLTSVLSQTYIILIFIPFIISIAKKMNLDKLTAFLCTFGAMLVGILGATYGTEGLVYFVTYLNYYNTVDMTVELGIRFGILALAFIVYSFFTIRHMKKVASKKDNEEEINDLFLTDDAANKKVKTWPMALFFVLIFAFTILGYVNWAENFNITVFDKFHTWLTGLAIGDYTIISYILGKNAVAFGSWELYMIMVVLVIILLLTIIIYKVKFDDVLDNALDGLKKMIKPVALIVFAFMVFVLIYWSPFTITITNWLVGDVFNPFLTAISAAITSFFHLDFGYTGYVLGELITSGFGDATNVGFLIYVTMHGLVQFVAPTSVLLLLGLSYLDIPYKKWIKYIWKFALVMLAVLLIIFALLTYL